jgi:hypothetical protein
VVSGTSIACYWNVKLPGHPVRTEYLLARERWLQSSYPKSLPKRPLPWGKAMDIPMEPKTFGLLVAILLFLVSLLVNLLQRRYAKTRLDRVLRKEESIVNFLEGIHKNLGKLEVTCTLEVQGASSPQEVGKTIHVARNEIQSTITNMEEHLHSFRQYRRKEKAREKRRKGLEKSYQRSSGG